MEADEKGDAQQEQAGADQAKEYPKIAAEEVRHYQATPPANYGGGRGGNEHPPENVPPYQPWYERFSITDWITAISALVSALATVVIMIWAGLQWNEMHTGGVDTHTLAQQAVTQATQTTNLATAAGTQAKELGDSIKQATRLADATEKANANALQSGRPWMGAVFKVSDFALGMKPTYTITYVNSGGRPAAITAAFNRVELYKDFPADPDKVFGLQQRGVRLIVPGQSYSMPNLAVHPLTQTQINEFNNGPRTLYLFGKVEYTDTRTGERYCTHICARYVPVYAGDSDSGFKTCYQYNDGK